MKFLKYTRLTVIYLHYNNVWVLKIRKWVHDTQHPSVRLIPFSLFFFKTPFLHILFLKFFVVIVGGSSSFVAIDADQVAEWKVFFGSSTILGTYSDAASFVFLLLLLLKFDGELIKLLNYLLEGKETLWNLNSVLQFLWTRNTHF